MSKENPITRSRDLSRFPHVDVAKVTVRETFGSDEKQAHGIVDAKGKGASTNAVLAQLGVVSYDDKPVALQPFGAWDKWNKRTRSFVEALWRSINGVSSSESKRLLATCAIAPGGGFVFSLAGFERVDCASFELREVDGNDERVAQLRADAEGDTTLAIMVPLSIVAIDGKAFAAGDKAGAFDVFDSFNSRTRTFVFAAWRAINSVSDDEISIFLDGEPEPDAAKTGSP